MVWPVAPQVQARGLEPYEDSALLAQVQARGLEPYEDSALLATVAAAFQFVRVKVFAT